MKKFFVEATKTLMFMIGVVVCSMVFANAVLDTPQGYYDSITNKCIGVLDKGVFRPCAEVPRHNRILVPPGTRFEDLGK